MTKEELREHCEKQVKACEMWAENRGQKPSGKIYEEHKLILDLINELQDKSYELWKESYEVELLRNIRLKEKIKALEQQSSEDCVSRAEIRKIAKEMYLEVANMNLDVHTISDCISYTSSKCRQVLEEKLQALPPVTPTIPTCDDCIARQPLIDNWNSCADMLMDEGDSAIVMDWIFDAPPVTPTHGTCKDCEYYFDISKDDNINNVYKASYCRKHSKNVHREDFYCADFEK